YSVSGVKYTTARRVAERVLERIARRGGPRGRPGRESRGAWPVSRATPLLTDASRLWSEPEESVRAALLSTVREEAVRTLDDLVLRRSNWAVAHADLEAVRKRIADLWPGARPELRSTGT